MRCMDALSIIPIQFLHGLVYGMLLFLVASGLKRIFGMMGVLNFGLAYIIEETVNASGINASLVFMLLSGVGGAQAGLAGVIGRPYLITNPGMAAQEVGRSVRRIPQLCGIRSFETNLR